MGALDEGHFIVELEKGCIDLGFEQEPETLAIEEAVRVLLEGLGEDVNREGIRKTPLRVAKALREGTRGYRKKPKDIVEGALFPEAGLETGVGLAGGVGGLVLVRDLDLFSYCESCLMPFQVKCHVGYVPSAHRVLGLSKFSRVADVFAKRLQEPQRLANEICSALQIEIKPTGIAVILQCSHIQFPNLEVAFLEPKHNGFAKILVSSGSGIFENMKADIWSDLLSLLKFRGVTVDKIHPRKADNKCWCPSTLSKIGTISNSGMLSAVASILESLGEDPSRNELQGTPARFVKWLMNFKKSNLDLKLNSFVLGRVDAIKSNGNICYNEDIHSELNLSFWAQCEHHLLPFNGVVHIGYVCNEEITPIGKSLLQSIVLFYGFKLQVQERLTRQIAETASSLLGGDIIVVVEATHTCMISRGIEKFGSSTATIAVLGRFSTDVTARATFLQKIPNFNSMDGSI